MHLPARHISKRKRVSLLYPLASATDPGRLFDCDDDVQRCDAKQPCTPCSKDEGSDCVYEQRQIKQRTRKKPPATARALPFSSKNERTPRRLPSPRMNSVSLSPPDMALSDTDSSLLSNLSNVPTKPSHLSDFDALDKFEPPAPRERVILEMKLVPFQKYPKPHQPATIPTFSVIPSLRLLSIPRPLHTSLQFLGPEHFQISDTTSSELDLTLCVFPFFRYHAGVTGIDLVCPAVLPPYYDRDCSGFTFQVPNKMLYYVEISRAPLSIHSSPTQWLDSGCISVPASDTHLEWSYCARSTLNELLNKSQK